MRSMPGLRAKSRKCESTEPSKINRKRNVGPELPQRSQDLRLSGWENRCGTILWVKLSLQNTDSANLCLTRSRCTPNHTGQDRKQENSKKTGKKIWSLKESSSSLKSNGQRKSYLHRKMTASSELAETISNVTLWPSEMSTRSYACTNASTRAAREQSFRN